MLFNNGNNGGAHHQRYHLDAGLVMGTSGSTDKGHTIEHQIHVAHHNQPQPQPLHQQLQLQPQPQPQTQSQSQPQHYGSHFNGMLNHGNQHQQSFFTYSGATDETSVPRQAHQLLCLDSRDNAPIEAQVCSSKLTSRDQYTCFQTLNAPSATISSRLSTVNLTDYRQPPSAHCHGQQLAIFSPPEQQNQEQHQQHLRQQSQQNQPIRVARRQNDLPVKRQASRSNNFQDIQGSPVMPKKRSVHSRLVNQQSEKTDSPSSLTSNDGELMNLDQLGDGITSVPSGSNVSNNNSNDHGLEHSGNDNNGEEKRGKDDDSDCDSDEDEQEFDYGPILTKILNEKKLTLASSSELINLITSVRRTPANTGFDSRVATNLDEGFERNRGEFGDKTKRRD